MLWYVVSLPPRNLISADHSPDCRVSRAIVKYAGGLLGAQLFKENRSGPLLEHPHASCDVADGELVNQLLVTDAYLAIWPGQCDPSHTGLYGYQVPSSV